MLPTARGMVAEGRPYRGVLFAGLMIKDGEVFLPRPPFPGAYQRSKDTVLIGIGACSCRSSSWSITSGSATRSARA